MTASLKEQEEEYGVNHVQRCWANHILLTTMPFKPRLLGQVYEQCNTLQMPRHSQCKQRPSMDNETLNTSDIIPALPHPPSTTTTTISRHSSMSTATSTPECRSALPTWLQYHTTRQPDGVKCGFIGFSPRLNRALLMEATAYLCNFYHRSKPNVGFIVAFIQSAILLLSKADFVNGGHILSLCH